jgi:hypothetical protein
VYTILRKDQQVAEHVNMLVNILMLQAFFVCPGGLITLLGHYAEAKLLSALVSVV